MEGNLRLEKNVLIKKGQLKTSVESSNEKFLCLCPQTFDRTYQCNQQLQMRQKKPPKTFKTTKVPLRHPNKQIVFWAAPN